MNNDDLRFMKLAISEAKKSKSAPEKIPIYVGVVVTKNGKILGSGHRGEYEIGVHAEVTVLEKLHNVNLEGTILYTTLEPCVTGSHEIEKYRWPCARWIVERKIEKVWIGDLDPNPNICGRGIAHLEDNGVTVEFFSADLKNELKDLNKKFIEKQKKPTILLADRTNEKFIIWRFLNNLQFQTNRSYLSRLLWFCGPPGIGKSELIRWIKTIAEERGLIKIANRLVLSDNPTLVCFRQLAKIEGGDLSLVIREGLSPEDYVCTAVARDLSLGTQPSIFIVDSDYRFNDTKGLSTIIERLLSKMELSPHVGIVVATRNLPEDIPTYNLQALSLIDVEEMVSLNNWQINKKIIEEIYKKSNGNPLLVILFHACYVKSGKVPGSTDIKEIIRNLLSHINPMGRSLLKKIAVALSAPFEQGDKKLDKDTIFATISKEEQALAENALKELVDMNILNMHSSLWMHDEIIEQIEKLMSENELVQQHFEFAQILKDKDPLGAIWHFIKSEKIDEAIALLELATNFAFEHLQILRVIKVFNELANWLEDLAKFENRVNLKGNYFFNIGIIYHTIADIEGKIENCKKSIEAYNKALIIYTFDRFPREYAATQNNLGNSYGALAEEETEAENCKKECNKAIGAYNEALRIYTFERLPREYAATQNNLGNTYRILAEVDDRVENCNKAIDSHKKALRIYTLAGFPRDYAMTQNNIGNTYSILAGIKDRVKNCKKSIESLKEALKIHTLARFPREYAMTQNNIGNAYRLLAEEEDKVENCKNAIKAYEEALRIYTLARFPRNYVKTQNNIGGAYGILAKEEAKSDNCRKAIKAYEEALKVSTEKEFPEIYQVVQQNYSELMDFLKGE